MKESAVRTSIKNKLSKLGYIVIKNTVVSETGWPDLSIYRNGATFFIETKSTGKNLTPKQNLIHQRLTAQGFVVLVIDSQPQIALLLQSLNHGQKDIPVL